MAKTATKSETAAPAKASIPAPRSMGPSPADLMKMFAKTATVKKPAAKDRAELELTPEAVDLVKDWVPGKILGDVFAENLKNAQAALDQVLFPLYVKVMWNSKSQPQNPKLVVKKDNGQNDMEGLFMVMEKLMISAPDTSDGSDPKEAFVTVLVSIGLQEPDARRLVEDELAFEPTMNIPLSELFYGKKVDGKWQSPTAIQSSAVAKLLTYMQMGESEPLTDEEKAVLTVVTSTNKVTVKSSGFLERAVGYCKSEDVLLKLLTLVIKPTLVHKSAKFGVSDSSDDKNRRLGEIAFGVLISALGSVGANSED